MVLQYKPNGYDFISRAVSIFPCVHIHSQRDGEHDNFRHQLSSDHTVQPHGHIHENKQRDIEQTLTAESEDSGFTKRKQQPSPQSKTMEKAAYAAYSI